MADPTFSNPVYDYDVADELYTCTLTVSGTNEKAIGVGISEFQAKRCAVATYKANHVIDFMDIPEG